MAPYPIMTPNDGGAEFINKCHHGTYDFIQQCDHQGRAIFITGGSRGIGRQIANSFARAGACKIALGDVRDFGNLEEELIQSATSKGHKSPQILLLKLDVTSESNVAHVAAQIQDAFHGHLDVLVHNAGLASSQAKVVDFDGPTWWRCCSVNLQGTFHVTKYFVPMLLKTEGGLKTMVNLNSVASLGVRPFSSDYATSKAAVLKFTEMLLVEEAELGLLAFSVHPGAVLSKLTEDFMPEDKWHLFEDPPIMAGDTISWLTQERREWLAGRWLSCNWDMEELLRRREEIEKHDKLKMRLVV